MATFAHSEDDTRKRLENAKDAYDKALAEFHTQVDQWFEQEDRKARLLRSGVSEQVAKIEIEKIEFSKTGNLPNRVPLKLRQKRNLEYSNLVRAYKTASDDYLRQKLDANAKLVADELRDLEKSNSSSGTTAPSVNELRFNGKDFSGWNGLPQFWTIQDGAILARNGKGLLKTGGTCLVAGKEFADFELTCNIRTSASPAPNCAIVFRNLPRDIKLFQVEGPFCRVSANKVDWGNIGYTGLRDLRQARNDIPNIIRIGEFNSFYIRCVGQHLIVKINGNVAIDDTIPRLPQKGMIGFLFFKEPQAGELAIRDVVIRDIPETTTGK